MQFIVSLSSYACVVYADAGFCLSVNACVDDDEDGCWVCLCHVVVVVQRTACVPWGDVINSLCFHSPLCFFFHSFIPLFIHSFTYWFIYRMCDFCWVLSICVSIALRFIHVGLLLVNFRGMTSLNSISFDHCWCIVNEFLLLFCFCIATDVVSVLHLR